MAHIEKNWKTLVAKAARRGGALHATLAACVLLSSNVPAFSSAYFDLEGQWIKTFNEGVTALDSNLYGKSEPLLKEAVDLSARFGAGDPRYPKSLGELGRLYTIRRRYAEAEPLLEQQLHFTEVQLGKNSGKTIPALGQLIKFYILYGTASKADPLAEELLGFIDGKMREDAELNAEHATPGKGKVLTAWAGTAPPATHIPRMDWAVTCDRLGDLYRYRKKFEMAERFYKAGLDIKVTIMGKEHMSMAVSYDNLGMLALDKEEYKDAEDYFRESLETTQKIMGNGDPDTYARLDRLAKALIKEKKFDEAEKTYYRALEIWKNEPNSAGAKARCLYQLGSMQCDIGRFGSAAGLLSQALNLSVKANGTLSYYNVPYMRKLAYALYYCGRHGESDGLKARANWLADGMEEPKAPEKTAEKADVKTASKPDQKTVDKTAEKPAAKPGITPGDKASTVAKGDASKAGKTVAGDKTQKISDVYDPDKKFIKPGTATAAETIRSMRDQGKGGPMKPVPEDEDEKPMNLMKMMREAEAGGASKTPGATQPSSTPQPSSASPAAAQAPQTQAAPVAVPQSPVAPQSPAVAPPVSTPQVAPIVAPEAIPSSNAQPAQAQPVQAPADESLPTAQPVPDSHSVEPPAPSQPVTTSPSEGSGRAPLPGAN